MIPKIIHYCWLSEDTFPADVQYYLDSWKKNLPDYEFKLWNFSCFDIESSQWVKEAFLFRKYAFAADYIRMYALYNFGGIYLDCDVEVLKSFDDMLDLPYFIGRERCKNVDEVAIEAAVMGFEKHNPLLKDILSYYENRHFIDRERRFDTRPLPSIILECIQKKYILKEIESRADFDSNNNVLSVFPFDYFSPKTWYDKDLQLTSNSYSIHHFAGTWLQKKRKANRLRFYYYRILGVFCKKYGL